MNKNVPAISVMRIAFQCAPMKPELKISIRVLSGSVLPCCVNIEVISGITLTIKTPMMPTVTTTITSG
jgi:hypothetical protein